MRPCCAVVLVLTSLSASAARAQLPSRPWFIQAGPAVYHQAGISGTEYAVSETAPGGTTLGWEVAAGRRLSRLVSLEAEVSSTGIMKATEPSRYGRTFVAEMRSRVVTLNARLHARVGALLQVETVIGVGLLRQNGWSRTRYDGGSASDREEQKPFSAACVSGGLDVRVGNSRLTVVPSFRVRRAFRGTAFAEDYFYSEAAETHLAVGLYGRVSF